MAKDNLFLDRSNLIRVPVSQVKEGMLVVELDRPWLETPFLLQGFVIRKQSEIRKLQECCDFVYIEKEGRSWGEKKDNFKIEFGGQQANEKGTTMLARAGGKKKQESSLVATKASRPEYEITVKTTAEHDFARKTYQQAKHTMEDVLEQARMGGALDTTAAKGVVTHCVDSILRNPNALMWMAKIKHADEYTLEHCMNVCVLAIAFGRHLRMSEDKLEELGICGLMHDVGKMRVSDEILNKPGRLSNDEYEEMKSHTTRGRDLLMEQDAPMGFSIDAAMNHHERMDGKGYPRGMPAAHLSEFSRIVSVVDAFDAMTSDRCYSKAKSTLNALKEIYRSRGTQFDEELALEFIQMIGPYPPGTIVELKNGQVGIVLSSQEKKRHLPSIKLILDENKKPQDAKIIELLDIERGNLGKDYLIAQVLKDGDHGIRLEDYPVRLAVKGQGPGTTGHNPRVKDRAVEDRYTDPNS